MKIGSPYYVTKISGKKRRKILNQDTFIYNFLRKTLKVLLQKSDIYSELNHEPTSTPGVLRDFCDGALYKKHPILSLPHKKFS